MNLSIIILVLSAIWVGSEISLALLKRSQKTDSRYDKSSLRVLWGAIFIAVNGGVLLGMQRVGLIVEGAMVFHVAGLVLIVVGLVIRWIAIFSLKRQFTVDVAITKDHHIISGGIYSSIRHPAYAGSLMSFLGLGVFFSNYLCILVIFVPVCVAFLYRIHVEEKALKDVFGDEYANYCATTKRLLPGVY